MRSDFLPEAGGFRRYKQIWANICDIVAWYRMSDAEVQRSESFTSREMESEMASDAAFVTRDEEIFQEVKSKETDFTFKIMCVGDYTGFGKKGGFVSDYIQHRPLSFYHKPTIGVDFYLNFIKWSDKSTKEEYSVKLQFWDVAEHERFLKMTSVFCRNCVGALVFWGPKSPSPLGSILKWSEKIKEANPKDANIPMVLVIENIPTSKRGKPVDWIGPGKLIESRVLLDEFCARNGFVGWFQLVSREGEGYTGVMTKAVDCLVQSIFKQRNLGKRWHCYNFLCGCYWMLANSIRDFRLVSNYLSRLWNNHKIISVYSINTSAL